MVVLTAPQLVDPRANIPNTLLPVAPPVLLPMVALVAKALVSPEYVYLFRVACRTNAPGTAKPSANMPTVLVPAAEPSFDAAVEAVAEVLVSPE